MNVIFWIVMGATVGVAVMLAVFKWGRVVEAKAQREADGLKGSIRRIESALKEKL